MYLEKNKSKKRGFTLVEAMVAISILSLSITGPMLIAQKGIGSAIYARDQITAFYLAQEAVEFIRNVRDSNRIRNSNTSDPLAVIPWLQQFNNCKAAGNSGKKCQIDSQYVDFSDAKAIQVCNDSSNPDGPCPLLSYNTSSGLYGYCNGTTDCTGWRPTAYTRTIDIDDRTKPNEAVITVTISWKTTLFNPRKSFVITEYLFDF